MEIQEQQVLSLTVQAGSEPWETDCCQPESEPWEEFGGGSADAYICTHNSHYTLTMDALLKKLTAERMAHLLAASCTPCTGDGALTQACALTGS